MKRCLNCGFTNQDEMVRCIKCNHPLSAVPAEKEMGNTSPNPEPVLSKGSSVQKTKTGIKVNAPAWDEPVSTNNPDTGANCPKCGYLVRAGETQCSKCGAELKTATATATPSASSLPDDCGENPSGNFKTVKRVLPKPKRGCRLVSLSLEDESEQASIPIQGENVVLNRELLDRNNDSISRSGHASLTLKDGQWYLDNLTSLKSTFVQVNGPVVLKDGDVILLGDRLFRFKVE